MKIKKSILIGLLIISGSSIKNFGMELESPESQDIQEEATLTHIPAEIKLLLIQNLTHAATKEEAIKDVLNFFKTHPALASFSRDEYTNKLIIQELAKKFYKGNFVRAALALNTPGAKLWLTHYLENKKNIQIARPPLFEAIYKKDNKRALSLLDSGLSIDIREPRMGRTPLMAAASINDIKLLSELLNRKANVNTQDNHGNTALFYAAKNGNLEAVKILQQAGASIDSANKSRVTPLIIAISRKHPEVATFLITKGANLNLQDKNGITALMEAAELNFPDLVKLLLSHHADPNIADNLGHTALIVGATNDSEIIASLLKAGAHVNVACVHGETPINNAAASQSDNERSIQLLLDANAEVNPPAGSLTPLMNAVSFGNIAIVKKLLSAGANVNAIDVNNSTPLIYTLTSIGYKPETLDLLLNAGADANPPAVAITPLIQAVLSGNLYAVKKLLSAGADVNAVDNNNQTALIYALSSPTANPEIVQELLNAGAQVNSSEGNQTPLMHAVLTGNLDIIKQLLAAGADVNAVDQTNSTALYYAVSVPTPNREIIQELLKSHANPNIANVNNDTPLLAAERADQPEILKDLIQFNADVNAKSFFGNTILSNAIAAQHVENVKILLNAHADPNIANLNQTTPLMLAAMSNQKEIVELLLAAGADKTIQHSNGRTAQDYARELGFREIEQLLSAE